MKYLILFAVLLCSQVVYGQDLIVTTSGDSLFCKIIDVNVDEIQFRFGKSGNVISIKRDETVLHRYNFKPASGSDASSGRSRTKSESSNEGGLDVALWAGANTFGKISAGEKETGGSFLLGADIAYFFNPNLGAGLKVNVADSDVNLSEFFVYHDRVIFFGPALYGRLGKGKLSLAVSAGVGGLNWQMSDLRIGNDTIEDESVTGIGGFLTAGVNFMLTEHLGLGLNLQSALGSLKTDNYERNPMSLGAVLGINYRF